MYFCFAGVKRVNNGNYWHCNAAGRVRYVCEYEMKPAAMFAARLFSGKHAARRRRVLVRETLIVNIVKCRFGRAANLLKTCKMFGKTRERFWDQFDTLAVNVYCAKWRRCVSI